MWENIYIYFLMHKNLWIDIGSLRAVNIQGEKNQTLYFDGRSGKEFENISH